jgi:hypothetical protein
MTIALLVIAIPGSASIAGAAGSGAVAPERVDQDSADQSHRAQGSGLAQSELEVPRSGASRCPDHRRGLVFYRLRWQKWQTLRGFGDEARARFRLLAIPASCPYVRFLAKLWRERAYRVRKAYEAWFDRHFVLHDTPYGDGNRAFLRSVVEVQRPFPGTQGWLVTCSWAEGKHGRWVVHGGDPYYAGAEYAKDGAEVGGNMQYTYGTFKGHFRRAVEDVLARGYRLPKHLLAPSVRAWRSALGQALAAAWARATGNDDEHWIASWATGCR